MKKWLTFNKTSNHLERFALIKFLMKSVSQSKLPLLIAHLKRPLIEMVQI